MDTDGDDAARAARPAQMGIARADSHLSEPFLLQK
jgi:hypothetical protein